MNRPVTNREIKACCATFYESDIVRMLLGDALHPGGLALTRHLGKAIGLGPGDRVLDVACGRGGSAIHLADGFGCHVTGVDYGPENIAAAATQAVDRGIAHLTTFFPSDAEALPLDDGTFDAVISECSFCTFSDKAVAAGEMARVLALGGRLGLTDMTLSGPPPDDVESLLAWVACVAGAAAPDEYVATLRAAGFGRFTMEDQRDALLVMVKEVRRKLLGVELVIGLGRMGCSSETSASSVEALTEVLGDVELTEAKRTARRVVELIEDGVVGYTLITAKSE